MITILAVGQEASRVAEAATGHASVEVLVARDSDEALEKLARNRRIDAVLITDSNDLTEVADVIRDEDPASPPLYAASAIGSAVGVRSLAGESPRELIHELIEALSPEP